MVIFSEEWLYMLWIVLSCCKLHQTEQAPRVSVSELNACTYLQEQYMLHLALILLGITQVSLKKIPNGNFHPPVFCKPFLLTFSCYNTIYKNSYH